jgi:hypothetical protein
MLEEGSARGILSRNGFWLHALLPWNEIAQYREKMRRFMPLFELRFHSSYEMMKLSDSIALQNEREVVRMISGLHDAHIFLGEWRIPIDSMIALKQTRTNVLGLPVKFNTEYGVFSVALQLSMVRALTYRLTWQVDIPLETRMEAYSLEMDVSGTLVPDGEHEILPCIHGSFEECHGGDEEEFGAGEFTEEDQLYKKLVAGHPLRCFARIAVSSMGDRCSVRPA